MYGVYENKVLDNSILGDVSQTNVSVTFMNGAGTGISNLVVAATGSCTTDTGFDGTALTAGETMRGALETCSGATVGNSFNIDITVTYDESVAGTVISRTETGRVSGTWEV